MSLLQVKSTWDFKPVGQTQTSKKIIKKIFHSLIELNKMILRCLTIQNPSEFWNGACTTIDGEDNPGLAASVFVLQAACYCAVRAQHMLRQQDIGPDHPNLSFYGDVIGAGMAEYWESGCKCHDYHELFFNRLLLVLYGGIGNSAEGILDNAEVF